jgi:hypothetical protein
MASDKRAVESQITTDRETIQEWCDDHGVVPVRDERSGELDLVAEDELRDRHEMISWNDFFEDFEGEEMVVLYKKEPEHFEVVGREEAYGRAAFEEEYHEEEFHEVIEKGEVVVGHITETIVVERTIVEEATIESELVGRRTLEETLVDAERVSRSVEGCDVTDVGPTTGEEVDMAQFETGHTVTDELDVEVDVNEVWDLEKEILEELLIHSRVVDVDVQESGEVESDVIESDIEIEGVQEKVLESNLLDTEARAEEIIGTEMIESERLEEENVIETRFLERKTVEEEVAIQKEFTGEITHGETVAAHTLSRAAVDAEIVSRQTVDEEVLEGGEETVVAGQTAEAEQVKVEGSEEIDERIHPSKDDEGKDVVDATGEKIGMVSKVEEDTIYVDPHPSLADKIKTALDWGDREKDAYPLDASNIARITDKQVELTVKE